MTSHNKKFISCQHASSVQCLGGQLATQLFRDLSFVHLHPSCNSITPEGPHCLGWIRGLWSALVGRERILPGRVLSSRPGNSLTHFAQYSIKQNLISGAHLASGTIQTQSSCTARKKRNRFGQYLTISATNTNICFCCNLPGEFLPLKKKKKREREREVSPFTVTWSGH